MSEVTDAHAARLLRAYQAQEKRFVERRFPLQFAPEVPALRELYSQAKGLRWNPETDIPWDRFDPARYEKSTREAARRTWSRRAWSVYPGLTESTALLIRFCLESGSLGMDAKLTGAATRPQGRIRIDLAGLRMRSGPARALPAANLQASA